MYSTQTNVSRIKQMFIFINLNIASKYLQQITRQSHHNKVHNTVQLVWYNYKQCRAELQHRNSMPECIPTQLVHLIMTFIASKKHKL